MHERSIRRAGRSSFAVLALVALSSGGLTGCAPGAWSPPLASDWRRSDARAGRSAYGLVFEREADAGSSAAPSTPREPGEPDPVARGLFVRNCATCHGLDGSGQGPSVLDRPARNFKDGGFSFGNTADAIFNTISHGIPGTPMPAFDPALDDGQRRRLADYVRTLGPPVDDVDVAETILAVTEESGPLIVRGILPPIVEGAPMRPRGMLVGLPAAGDGSGGLTFEYRIDDVRLLGVRQGGFVERTDWRDRGGTPLKPLGGVIWTDGGGDPPATFTLEFRLEDGTAHVEPLSARLDGNGPAGICYALCRANGTAVGIAIECGFPVHRGSLSGFSRGLTVHLQDDELAGPFSVRVRIPVPEDAPRVESFVQNRSGDRVAPVEWRIFRRADGVHECIGTTYAVLIAPDGHPGLEESADGLSFVVPLTPSDGKRLHAYGFGSIQCQYLFTANWSSGARSELRESPP